MLLLSKFRVYNFSSHKVTAQLSAEYHLNGLNLNYFSLMYIFNCLIMALPKAKTCSKQ